MNDRDMDNGGVWITRDEARTLGDAVHLGMIRDIYHRDDRARIARAVRALSK